MKKFSGKGINSDHSDQEINRDIVNNRDLSYIFENISELESKNLLNIDIKNIKSKEITSFIQDENLSMAKEIINNQDIFSNLNNEYKLVLADVLNNDRINGQKYLHKIIENSDDDLILLIARNKKIYHNLNRENKLIVNAKLLKNPWLTKNINPEEENEKRFRTETMKFLFDTRRIKSPLELLTEM